MTMATAHSPASSQRLAIVVVAAAVMCYIGAHFWIVFRVWAIVGTVPGAWRVLLIDSAALAVWLFVLSVVLCSRRCRGGDAWLVILPFLLWSLTRPYQAALLTDPLAAPRRALSDVGSYPNGSTAGLPSRTEAAINRLRLHQLEAAQLGPTGDAELKRARDSVRVCAFATAMVTPRWTARWLVSSLAQVLAPLAVLVGFLASNRGVLSAAQFYRRPLVLVTAFGIVAARFSSVRGILAGFSPVELVLGVAAVVLAAVIAERIVELRLSVREALEGARGTVGAMLVIALTFIPLGAVGGPRVSEFGLLAVLMGAMVLAAISAVHQRRFVVTVAAAAATVVVAVFLLSERPRERLGNAFRPYPTLAGLSIAEREKQARRNLQIRASDGGVLDGSYLGSGLGRGGAALIPRAADDLVFAGLAADYGLLGVLSLSLLYAVLLHRIAKLAHAVRDGYARTVVAALGGLLALPWLLSWFGAMRAVPLTGVSAAFVSNGGAKLLAALVGQGILLHYSREVERQSLLASHQRRGF